MSSKSIPYEISESEPLAIKENDIENSFIQTLIRLKYTHRPDIHDRDALERNFREKFEALNRVHLTDSELARLLEEIITDDVFKAAKMLRERHQPSAPHQTVLFHIALSGEQKGLDIFGGKRFGNGDAVHRPAQLIY